MATLDSLNLSKEQKEFTASVINRFGSTQHPCADDQTINYFTIPYVKGILNKKKFIQQRDKITAEGQRILKELQEKLNINF
jgi:hypothetical protein